MRKIIFLTLALLSCRALPAQNRRIPAVKERLSRYETGANGRSARVEVREAEGAAEAVRRGESGAVQTVNGFRIVIFFDNSSSARSEAERTMAEFAAAYPDVRCDIRYENPYFKVLAGNCVNSEDAVILLGRVRSSFPEAYITREEMPASSFITPKLPEPEIEEILPHTENIIIPAI